MQAVSAKRTLHSSIALPWALLRQELQGTICLDSCRVTCDKPSGPQCSRRPSMRRRAPGPYFDRGDVQE
eukprot:5417824-Pyramimonas_sp.AAC.1